MAIALATLSLAGSALAAPVETVLYSFKGGSDGSDPAYAGVIADKQGALYGTTSAGGVGGGVVFMLTPPDNRHTSWVETVLHTFFSQSDGYQPVTGLLAFEDILYGVTTAGGNGSQYSNYGTVFDLTRKGQNAWTESVLYGFNPSIGDGIGPRGRLIASDAGDVFYGTTFVGGSAGTGTVFKLTPPAHGQTVWTETVLHSFCSQPSCAAGIGDGSNPSSGLVAYEGSLYGTTEGGGSTGNGTVFKLTPNGTAWTYTVLYSFKGGSDGSDPFAGLVSDNHGTFYGTTTSGGIGSGGYFNNGTVFKITADGTETIIYRFCPLPGCSDGAFPLADLIISKSGALYGTTAYGGLNNGGTIFKLTKPTNGQSVWNETVLYRFGSKNSSDGVRPSAGLIASQGALYSTTQGGGTAGFGTVFKLMGSSFFEDSD